MCTRTHIDPNECRMRHDSVAANRIGNELPPKNSIVYAARMGENVRSDGNGSTNEHETKRQKNQTVKKQQQQQRTDDDNDNDNNEANTMWDCMHIL